MDDLLLFAREIEDIKVLKRELAEYFKIKDMGEVQEVLNMHVERVKLSSQVSR